MLAFHASAATNVLQSASTQQQAAHRTAMHCSASMSRATSTPQARSQRSKLPVVGAALSVHTDVAIRKGELKVPCARP
ncbi:hypothetical protein PENSPDRAFT_648182 [Peniophora sp. CONT]|nr:hypothetical protein PENSPDRAFT_648182 [Peniophora sp. CONT]